MANDRLYLVCTRCQAQQMLYKYYPGGGYTAEQDKIDAFIREHLDRHELYYSHDFGGVSIFAVMAESDPARPPITE